MALLVLKITHVNGHRLGCFLAISVREVRARTIWMAFSLFTDLQSAWGIEFLRLLLGLFHSIFRSRRSSSDHTCEIQCSSNNLIFETNQILSATTSDQDDGMFLQVVAFALDISDDSFPVCEFDFSDLADGRVRFARLDGVEL